MATPKKDLEIHLASLELDKATFKGEADRIANFTALYPRLSIAQKTTSKTMRLKDGEWPKLSEGRWSDAILFKESVQGDFAIEFTLSDSLSTKEIENALATGAASLLKLFGDLTAGAVGIKAAGAFMELPADVLAKSLSSTSYHAKVVASGTLEIPGSAYGGLKSGDETALAFDIIAAQDIVETRHLSSKSRPAGAARKTLVKKGRVIGKAALRLKAL